MAVQMAERCKDEKSTGGRTERMPEGQSAIAVDNRTPLAGGFAKLHQDLTKTKAKEAAVRAKMATDVLSVCDLSGLCVLRALSFLQACSLYFVLQAGPLSLLFVLEVCHSLVAF